LNIFRFLHGEGVPKDIAVAKEWFQIASTQGYEPAQSMLQQLDVMERNAAAATAAAQQQESETPLNEKRTSRWSLGFFNKKK
jgi:TPR repeat protein